MKQQRSKIRVEKIYANSYYQNLLLHLPKILHMNKQIIKLTLPRLKPQTESHILQWEDYNGVFLPNDLKDFYLAHDGFLLLWTYNPMPNGSSVQCGININCLNDLYAMKGYEVSTKAGISMTNGRKILALSINSRVFGLEPLGGKGNHDCVCLVYYNIWLRPTVWLWSKSNGFFFLSKDFTTYFRMCITHLGIIGWQYTFTAMELPKWTCRIIRKIAPHLLRSPYDCTVLSQEQTSSQQCVLWRNRETQEAVVSINKLNPDVFMKSTMACPKWANNTSTKLDELNIDKSRPSSVMSNMRKNDTKKRRSKGQKFNASKSTTGYYSKRYIISPKVNLRKSKT